MAEEQAKGAGGALPPGVERSRLVLLPVCRKTVEVRRWSYTRLMSVSKFLAEAYEAIPEGDTMKALAAFYEHGAGRFFEVARLSVAPDSRGVIDEEMDASDAFALMDAVFAINGEDNLKKASGLAVQFLLGRAAALNEKKDQTPQEPPASQSPSKKPGDGSAPQA